MPTNFDAKVPGNSPFILSENRTPPSSSHEVNSQIQLALQRFGEVGDQNASSIPTTVSPAGYSAFNTSFGAAGDELRLHTSPRALAADIEEPRSRPAPVVSPAAAFLSSFSSPVFSPPPPDATGLKVAGYTLGATIGHGGFSTVKEAVSPTGAVVAVKIVLNTVFDHLSPEDRMRQQSRFTHEERIWASLSHENILPLFHCHHTPEATYFCTLHCPAGSLFDILKRDGHPALEQTDAGCMFRQVVKGLQYMHDTMGLVHGDIKLENVLVDESGVCRLSDFGLTRHTGGTPCSSDEERIDRVPNMEVKGTLKATRDRSRGRRSGTSALPVHLSLMRRGKSRHRNSIPTPLPSALTPPTHPDHAFLPGSLPYAAPELLLPRTDVMSGRGTRYLPNPAQDMWALGVLLYALLTGGYPFQDPFEPRLQMKILRGTYELPPAIGPHAESVLKGCLELDVRKRWTISMVDDAAWGIGYGNVDLDPAISEEQRAQSQSRKSKSRSPEPADESCEMTEHEQEQEARDDEMALSMSELSFTVSSPRSASRSNGRRSPSTHQPRPLDSTTHPHRGSSRSPSLPRTPADDLSPFPSYFVEPTQSQRATKRVRVVLGDDEHSPSSLGVTIEDEAPSPSDSQPRGRPGREGKGHGPPSVPAVKRLQNRSRSRSFDS